ncbi:MAG: hypothetical protein ACPH5P_04675 [Akkermansiaceae bacterium]
MQRLVERRPPWFWWFLALILASCFSALSWSLCISIFSHPEIPRNYEILKKLERLPTPRAYTSQTAPKLPTASAATLRKSYLAFTTTELTTINRSLLHSYLTNFDTKTFSCYLEGTYKVIQTRELTEDDIISRGFALQLRAYTQADEYTGLTPYPVIAEIIVPTPYRGSHKHYHKGDIIELGITPHFASLLNISKIIRPEDDTIILVTAVSLASKLRPPHSGPFDLSPPRELNLMARFPLFAVED